MYKSYVVVSFKSIKSKEKTKENIIFSSCMESNYIVSIVLIKWQKKFSIKIYLKDKPLTYIQIIDKNVYLNV